MGVVEGRLYSVYVPEMLEPVEPQLRIFDNVVTVTTGLPADAADLVSKLGSADGAILTSKTRFTRSLADACDTLKIIGKYGVGIDNIDVSAATEKGILVCNTPGVNTNAVAELSLGLILAALRNIQVGKKHIGIHGWKDASLVGRELAGSVIGIVGYGSIARALLEKLSGLDLAKVLVYSESSRSLEYNSSLVEFTTLSTLLKNSDIVTIHKALTTDSRHLIGADEMRCMKKGSYIINTSRGSLIDEEALTRFLASGHLAGAALDVFDREPLPKESPLMSMDNVVVTPHIGGFTWSARQHMVTTMAKNIVGFLTERRVDPGSVVNPEVLRQ